MPSDEFELSRHLRIMFGADFKESKISVPYLQGAPRLKRRLLPEEVRQKALAMLQDMPDVADILAALAISEENFVNWLMS